MQRGHTSSIILQLAAEEPSGDALSDSKEYVMVSPEDYTEDFEMCETPSPKEMKKFQEFRDAYVPTKAYEPDDLNRIILKKFKNKFSYQESYECPRWATLSYHILTKQNNQKIILTGAGAQFKTQKDWELPTLEDILIFIKERKIYTPENDILVIPITEPFRGIEPGQGHFRLVALVRNTTIFFDSKNYVLTKTAGLFTPFRSAAELTLEEVAEQIADKSLLEKLVIMAKSLVTTLPLRYMSLDSVKTICDRHYPGNMFIEHAMNRQARNNHTDCALHAIEAAINVAIRLSPEEAQEETPHQTSSPPAISLRA